jgi:hypothetical protein
VAKAGVKVDRAQLAAARRKLRGLPRDLNRKIRDASGQIAADELPRLQDAAQGDPLSEIIAQGLAVRRDRAPAIRAGGNATVAALADGRSKLPTFGDLFFGAEFGGQGRPTTRQFRPHRGRAGYWLYPQLRDDAPRMLEDWTGVIDDLITEWETDRGGS